MRVLFFRFESIEYSFHPHTQRTQTCGLSIIQPAEFCHGFSNRYLCLLYFFTEYVQESGQVAFWGSSVNDVSYFGC